jgi:hypothetical protein
MAIFLIAYVASDYEVFGSRESAEDFLSAPHLLGPGLIMEIAMEKFAEVLEICVSFGLAEYVVFDPPPQRWDGGQMVAESTSAKDFAEYIAEHSGS